MVYGEWARGPFGLDAQRGQTLRYQRTALAIVHTVPSADRLADVVPSLEADRRVQVVFTHAPSALISGGVEEYLARLGGVVIPWRQAVQSEFDLALAASDGLLEWVHAPVVTMLHGAGYNKYPVRWDGYGPLAHREASGPEPARLICHGRMISSAIIVPTQCQADRLRRSCPEAAAVAVVAGDPCYDRLLASRPLRDSYRTALGVGNRKLVVVSSTWGQGSLLNRHPGLLAELMEQLPPQQYQLAAVVHPGAWYWHSGRQIRAWYYDCVRRGLLLVPPDEGWRAVLAAADVLIGDHGSVSAYAAAAGIPVVLAASPADEVEPGSPVALLGQVAPRLKLGRPYPAQLDRAAAAWTPEQHAVIEALVTDVPGRSASALQELMYRLMKLRPPSAEPEVRPVALPEKFQ